MPFWSDLCSYAFVAYEHFFCLKPIPSFCLKTAIGDVYKRQALISLKEQVHVSPFSFLDMTRYNLPLMIFLTTAPLVNKYSSQKLNMFFLLSFFNYDSNMKKQPKDKKQLKRAREYYEKNIKESFHYKHNCSIQKKARFHQLLRELGRYPASM